MRVPMYASLVLETVSILVSVNICAYVCVCLCMCVDLCMYFGSSNMANLYLVVGWKTSSYMLETVGILLCMCV